MIEVAPGVFQSGALDRTAIDVQTGINNTLLETAHIFDVVPPNILAILSVRDYHQNRFIPGSLLKASLWMPCQDAPPFKGLEWLSAAVEFIETCRRKNWPILVHCAMGISRSSLVTVAYTMKSQKLGVADALRSVRQNHPNANPNQCFMEGLHEYEKHLDKGNGSLALSDELSNK